MGGILSCHSYQFIPINSQAATNCRARVKEQQAILWILTCDKVRP